MDSKTLSICIPSYNRPNELIRLLKSISKEVYCDIEIVISEDKSPRRKDINLAVENFKLSNPDLELIYSENEKNLGYDLNLKELIKKANGKFIMFMGDDDTFVTKNIFAYINFLKKNEEIGYILRRYSIIDLNNKKESFRYFNSNKFFNPGLDSMLVMLRRSVFISGFCFKREYVKDIFDTNYFAGTLLYQLFLCAELCLNHKSAYCDIHITEMNENQRGIPEFGNSNSEKELYSPGEISIQNSINFVKSFFVITGYIDNKYKLDSTSKFLLSFSKYSYPVLSIQRDKGFNEFIRYKRELLKEIPLNKTIFFYIYYYSLLFLGKNTSDSIIIFLKNKLGYTPNL